MHVYATRSEYPNKLNAQNDAKKYSLYIAVYSVFIITSECDMFNLSTEYRDNIMIISPFQFLLWPIFNLSGLFCKRNMRPLTDCKKNPINQINS